MHKYKSDEKTRYKMGVRQKNHKPVVGVVTDHFLESSGWSQDAAAGEKGKSVVYPVQMPV